MANRPRSSRAARMSQVGGLAQVGGLGSGGWLGGLVWLRQELHAGRLCMCVCTPSAAWHAPHRLLGRASQRGRCAMNATRCRSQNRSGQPLSCGGPRRQRRRPGCCTCTHDLCCMSGKLRTKQTLSPLQARLLELLHGTSGHAVLHCNTPPVNRWGDVGIHRPPDADILLNVGYRVHF